MFIKDNVLVGIKDHEGHLVPSSHNNEIKLKFNESYSIYISNKNYFDIAVEISIDGTKVLGENKVKVDRISSINIDRFCIDGNGEEGRKFKFVPISDSVVQDPDSKSNGNIEIRIYKGKETTAMERILRGPSKMSLSSSSLNKCKRVINSNPTIVLGSAGPVGIGSTSPSDGVAFYPSVTTGSTSSPDGIATGSSISFSHNSLDSDSLDYDSDSGATVEGGISDQKIENVDKIDIEETPSILFSFKLKGEKNNKENKTDKIQSRVIIVLDKSGSMCSCRREAIKAFNNQIDILKNSPDNVNPRISLLTFNSTVGSPLYKNIDVKKATYLKEKDYIPSGGTAMLDGVGTAISFLNSLEEAEDDNTAFLVIIISDGEENSSNIFGYNEISNLINGRQKTGKWTFSYLGANGLDLAEVNEKMSISKGNIQMFNSDSKGMEEASNKTVMATDGYTQRLSRGIMNSSCYYSGEED